MEQKLEYYAFISYSHKDHRLAKKLQARLQRYHLPSKLQQSNPGLPKNLRPIFIDESNLIGSVLQDAIQNNLSRSKFLILICSPNSAKSDYVNDEVKYFIENGKGNRIIPLIIDGTPHADNPELECFPPAILALPKELEPLGIDLRKFGIRGAFLRVIATLLGLDLENFVSYEDQLRRKRIAIFTPIAVVLAFIAGLLVWQNIPHTHYYQAYVYRWEKPVGLFEVESEADRSKMEYTYKFTLLRGNVQKIERVNSAGVLVEPSIVTPLIEPPMIRFLSDNSVEYFDLYRHKLYRKRYLSQRVADFYCAGSEILYALPMNTAGDYDSNRYNPEYSSSHSSGNIIRVTLEFDANGYVVKKLFRSDGVGGNDKLGNPTRDSKGRWGLGYTLDELGRVIAIHNLDANGKIAPVQGVCSETFDYGEFPRPVKSSHVDANGELVTNENGYAFEVVSYDEYCNAVKLAVFDTDGKPALDKRNKIHEIVQTYDTNGFLTSLSCYDTNHEPCLDTLAYFRIELTNDSNGRIVKYSFYDVNNEKSICSGGYSEISRELNGNGQVLLETYHDINGKPISDRDNNVYAARYSYNNGFVNKIEFLDQNAKLMLGKNGYASYSIAYDPAENKVMGFTYMNTNGEKILNSNGFAEERYTYVNGNRDTIAYYDTNAEPIPDKSGVAKYAYEYDYGNLISAQCLGTDGKAVFNSEAYSRFENDYDDNGLKTCTRYYGTDGKRVNCAKGYSAVKYDYDSLGNLVSESYYDPDDKPAILFRENYCSGKRFKYDNNGNLIHTQYLRPENSQYQDMLDRLVSDEYCEYDLHGRETRRYRLNSLGEEVLYTDNESDENVRRELEYDIHGRRVKTLFYTRGEKQPSTIQEYEFDTFGREITAHGLRHRGNHTDILTVKSEYDQFGNKIRISYLDADGKLTLFGQIDHAMMRAKYDVFGNQIENWYYGKNAEPIRTENRTFHTLRTYDSKGKRLSLRYYDSEDYSKPGTVNGVHRLVYEYDALGREIILRAYDTDDNLLQSNVTSYDVFGRKLSEASYDSEGKALTRNKVFKTKYAYDTHGNLTDTWYFDANDNPCRRVENFFSQSEHHRRNSYDLMGNLLRVELFNTEDNPDSLQFYYKLENVYNSRGLVSERIYYDRDNVVVRRVHAEYDSEGRKLSEKWDDLFGEKLATEAKAKAGDPNAQLALGVIYENGKGVKQNYAEAVYWYRKSAEQGNIIAQDNLGVMYENGRGVGQDYVEALKWYRKAAEQGRANAQCNLGLMYENGRGVEQDYVESVKWYRKAAEQGHARAQNNLGVKYENGRGVGQDYVEAVKWYRKAAEQGNAYAQCNIGYMYENSRGVERNYVESVKWYRKAAEQGHARAQDNLGVMYEHGTGVEQDYVEALKWYRKAAEQGRANAQCNLGGMYYYGKGVERDYAEVLKWFRKAAEQGHARAQNNLGLMYKNGTGVLQDYAEAVRWYRKSAEQGHASAQFNLGLMYKNGTGVLQDYAEALKWYRKAADQGNVYAQFNLGLMYKNGTGVLQDYAEAMKCCIFRAN